MTNFQQRDAHTWEFAISTGAEIRVVMTAAHGTRSAFAVQSKKPSLTKDEIAEVDAVIRERVICDGRLEFVAEERDEARAQIIASAFVAGSMEKN